MLPGEKGLFDSTEVAMECPVPALFQFFWFLTRNEGLLSSTAYSEEAEVGVPHPIPYQGSKRIEISECSQHSHEKGHYGPFKTGKRKEYRIPVFDQKRKYRVHALIVS